MNEDKISYYKNELKSYIYSWHFTINLLGNDVSHRFAIAIYSPYSEYYFVEMCLKKNRRRENISPCVVNRGKCPRALFDV